MSCKKLKALDIEIDASSMLNFHIFSFCLFFQDFFDQINNAGSIRFNDTLVLPAKKQLLLFDDCFIAQGMAIYTIKGNDPYDDVQREILNFLKFLKQFYARSITRIYLRIDDSLLHYSSNYFYQ